MPDVSSNQPADVRVWVSLDVHKLSIVAATLSPVGGRPEVQQIETTRVAIGRFIDRLGGPEGLAVCYEAGPGGFDLLRLLGELGVACDVVAPSLIPVRAGDRVKTDRRDAQKLVRLYRGGQLSFVAPPSPETEGLRDLMRCRDDLRSARTAARHRVNKQLLRHGRIFRDGKTHWTKLHRRWIVRQRLEDELANAALCQMLLHLDGLDRQLDALDRDLEQIARGERWAPTVQILTNFKGVSTRTALGLISEIGDFARFSHPRELCSWLGIVPSEYSSGQQRHRGHITKAGNQHARRILIEAAWSYQHPPRLRDHYPDTDQRAWNAQIRLHRRYKHLTTNGKRSTVATVAIARELAGFLWAAATNQPILQEAAA
jgi:transposase